MDSTSEYGPLNAIDVKTGAFMLTKNDTCSVTKVNTLSYWWTVNLGQKYIIGSISLIMLYSVTLILDMIILLYDIRI